VNVDPETTFTALQQALEALQPQVTQPVKLYLRLAGQKHTYAKHYFTLQPAQLVTTKNDSLSLLNPNDLKEQAPEVADWVHSDQYDLEKTPEVTGSVQSTQSLLVEDPVAYPSSFPVLPTSDVETGSTTEPIDHSLTPDSSTDLQPIPSPEISENDTTTEELIDHSLSTDAPTDLQPIPSPEISEADNGGTTELIDRSLTPDSSTGLQPSSTSPEISENNSTTEELIDYSLTIETPTGLQPIPSPEISEADNGSTAEELIDRSPTLDNPTNLQPSSTYPEIVENGRTTELIDRSPTPDSPIDLQQSLPSPEIVDRKAAHPAQIYSSTTTGKVSKRKLNHTLSLLLVVGGGVVLAAIFTSIYMLTRPCVIGRCKPLQTAQQLNQGATRMAKSADSQSELLAAQQQLVAANNSLKQIPRWSGHYQEAQQLSQSLFNQSALLNQAIAALQQGARATQRSQNPPRSALELQTIQALWQDAIANLAAVPSDSALFPLAQQKLPAYQTNLKSVNQQLQMEQQASKKLILAQKTALLAKQRQDTAQSWQAWQTAKSNWVSAIDTLATIPKTSAAYKEAQQLLPTYQTQLATASDRASKEQMAAKAFSQAISQANLAQREQQQNQFTNAVNNWKQALTYAKQVPSGTLYYKQVQPLITSYSETIQQAQAQLKVANVLQKARTDLNRTCSSNIRVCTYTVNNKLIVVQLTSGYEQTVERNYIVGKRKGDLSLQAGIAFHYRALRQALEIISANADIPLQVYEPDGSLIHSYKPQ
jgi:CRISPR/Cas system CSM-associated protein Csm2 small subunit